MTAGGFWQAKWLSHRFSGEWMSKNWSRMLRCMLAQQVIMCVQLVWPILFFHSEQVFYLPEVCLIPESSGGMSLVFRRWATKKTAGSTKNGRDSNPKYLGVKKFGGEVHPLYNFHSMTFVAFRCHMDTHFFGITFVHRNWSYAIILLLIAYICVNFPESGTRKHHCSPKRNALPPWKLRRHGQGSHSLLPEGRTCAIRAQQTDWQEMGSCWPCGWPCPPPCLVARLLQLTWMHNCSDHAVAYALPADCAAPVLVLHNATCSSKDACE